jgi:hypothetical protein
MNIVIQNKSRGNMKSGKERNYQRMNAGNKYFIILKKKIFHKKYNTVIEFSVS